MYHQGSWQLIIIYSVKFTKGSLCRGTYWRRSKDHPTLKILKFYKTHDAQLQPGVCIHPLPANPKVWQCHNHRYGGWSRTKLPESNQFLELADTVYLTQVYESCPASLFVFHDCNGATCQGWLREGRCVHLSTVVKFCKIIVNWWSGTALIKNV